MRKSEVVVSLREKMENNQKGELQMSHTKLFKISSLLMIVALLLGAWQPVIAQEDQPAPEPQGLRYDAPEYAVDGPYAVGVRYFSIPAVTEKGSRTHGHGLVSGPTA